MLRSLIVAASLNAAVGFRMGVRMGATLSQDELKKQAGYRAVDDYVKSGMKIGLGTGSTAAFAVERVGQKLASGELTDIVAVPTSERTREQAEGLGIPLATLNEYSHIDVSIDGADSVDPDLNLIKGGGGALLREKQVEIVSDKFIVIVDESKLCDALGPHFAIPVEVTPFCYEHTRRLIEGLPSMKGCKAVLRTGSSTTNVNDPADTEPAVSDNGNYLIDCVFTEPLKDPVKAADELINIVGVVEHGIFQDMTTACIVAASEGIKVLEK